MPVIGLSHVNLRLSGENFAAVRNFYVNLLGLVDGYRPPFESSGCWLYAGRQPVVHLVRASSDESGNTPGIVDHFALQSSDYEEMVHRLDAAGVTYEERRIPQTTQRQLFFLDPMGVGIELLFDD